MHIDFPKAIHVHSLNNIQKETAWIAKIARAVKIAESQGRTHVVLVFEKRECNDINNKYLHLRFLSMAESFAELGYIVQIAPIPQGYSFLLSWEHHERAAQ